MRLDEADTAITERVRSTLAELGVSAAELARRMNVKQPYIARRMTGDVPWRAIDLQLAAAALGVPVTQFLPGEAAA
jgi:transcriptional regulator with XRE-family HTH domain